MPLRSSMLWSDRIRASSAFWAESPITWTRGSATGAPADPVANGTYGRWRYVQYLNVFVLFNDPAEDVWVARLR